MRAGPDGHPSRESARRRARRPGPAIALGLATTVVVGLTSAPAATAATRTYPVSATVDGRLTRSLADHAAPHRYPAGTRIAIACQASGPAVSGNPVWDLTGDGLWVPDRWVKTGSVGWLAGTARCALPLWTVVTRAEPGRRSRSMTDAASPGRFRAGARVAVVCQAAGGPTGSAAQVWDRTADGWWLPDTAVRTGVDGFLRGLPRCNLDSPVRSPAPRPTPTPGPTPTPPPVPAPGGARRLPADLHLSDRGASLIASFEGYVGHVYDDPVGHCTVGYGHLVHTGRCTPTDATTWGTLTPAQARSLLRTDADRHAAGLRTQLARTPLRQTEFDALVSFAYNVGLGGFGGSSVRADLAATPPAYAAVPAHLLRWDRAGGRELCSLYRRRVAEGAVFRSGEYSSAPVACPAATAHATSPAFGPLRGFDPVSAGPATPADLRPQPAPGG